jgi:hypothetical protein
MKMFCVTHLPIVGLEDAEVTPIYVGRGTCPDGWLRDDTGDNIHEKNATFCELTAQYWVWKNLLKLASPTAIFGFCHYRRFFGTTGLLPMDRFAESDKSNGANLLRAFQMSSADVVLPFPLRFDAFPVRGKLLFLYQQIKRGHLVPYWKHSIYTDFNCFHSGKHLLRAAELLDAEYRQEFLRHIRTSSTLYPFNMYVSSSRILSDYFDALFPWLFRCEKELEVNLEDSYQRRLFGFLAERFCSYYFARRYSILEAPIFSLRQEG